MNFNGEDFLRPCLNSLRRQTFRSLEVIVVDNIGWRCPAEDYASPRLVVGFCEAACTLREKPLISLDLSALHDAWTTGLAKVLS